MVFSGTIARYCVPLLQEVQQRKTAQKESARWQSELEKVEPQLTAANTTIAELQAANADMRVQLAACKQQMTPSESAAVVGQLQQLLAQKNAEVAGLKRALQDMQQRLAVAGEAGGRWSVGSMQGSKIVLLCVVHDAGSHR